MLCLSKILDNWHDEIVSVLNQKGKIIESKIQIKICKHFCQAIAKEIGINLV